MRVINKFNVLSIWVLGISWMVTAPYSVQASRSNEGSGVLQKFHWYTDFQGGIPSVLVVKSFKKESKDQPEMTAHLNWGGGMTLGYEMMHINSQSRIMPEVGLYMGSKRVLKVRENATRPWTFLEERMLTIPVGMGVHITQADQSFLTGVNLSLGIDLNLALNSQVYEETSDNTTPERVDFFQKNPTLPRWSSALYVRSRYLFQGGFSGGAELKLPLGLLNMLRDTKQLTQNDECVLARGLMCSMGGFFVGVDLTHWLRRASR